MCFGHFFISIFGIYSMESVRENRLGKICSEFVAAHRHFLLQMAKIHPIHIICRCWKSTTSCKQKTPYQMTITCNRTCSNRHWDMARCENVGKLTVNVNKLPCSKQSVRAISEVMSQFERGLKGHWV